ncbi:MAG: hypothetical protein WBP45_00765 [Daejeonella sp.]
MKKLLSISTLLIGGMVIISCGGKTEQKADNTTEKVEEVDKKVDDNSKTVTESSADEAPKVDESAKSEDFLRSNAIEKAFEKLKNMDKFKGKKIMVFQNMHFYGAQGGRITLSISDPDKPENVDEYTYSGGTWGSPSPVQLRGAGKVSENLVNLDEINYKAIPNMMKIGDEKAKSIEGGKVDDHFYFVFNPTFNTKFFKMGSIQGTRETYDIKFDINGNLKEFEKQ